MQDSTTQNRIEEFNRFVWNHSEDEFQGKFDDCAFLDDQETSKLVKLLSESNLDSTEQLSATLDDILSEEPEFILLLLQIVGLTRNKILSDIKGKCGTENRPRGLSKATSLVRNELGRKYACEYLVAHLQRVFRPESRPVSIETLQALRQATWPGYVRQERAKRMGHEAERRLGVLFKECGLPFEPIELAENPLCQDIDIDGQSYDLVSPNSKSAFLRVLSTVHTSNIGQYGESKDALEMKQANETMINAGVRNQVTLLALVDGVGFESNRKGLAGVLASSDEFCQFATIWKAAVIGAFVNKKSCSVFLPENQRIHFHSFCKKYGANIESSKNPNLKWVEAGDSFISVIN